MAWSPMVFPENQGQSLSQENQNQSNLAFCASPWELPPTPPSIQTLAQIPDIFPAPADLDLLKSCAHWYNSFSDLPAPQSLQVDGQSQYLSCQSA